MLSCCEKSYMDLIRNTVTSYWRKVPSQVTCCLLRKCTLLYVCNSSWASHLPALRSQLVDWPFQKSGRFLYPRVWSLAEQVQQWGQFHMTAPVLAILVQPALQFGHTLPTFLPSTRVRLISGNVEPNITATSWSWQVKLHTQTHREPGSRPSRFFVSFLPPHLAGLNQRFVFSVLSSFLTLLDPDSWTLSRVWNRGTNVRAENGIRRGLQLCL